MVSVGGRCKIWWVWCGRCMGMERSGRIAVAIWGFDGAGGGGLGWSVSESSTDESHGEKIKLSTAVINSSSDSDSDAFLPLSLFQDRLLGWVFFASRWVGGRDDLTAVVGVAAA